jgi:hypothetical protein
VPVTTNAQVTPVALNIQNSVIVPATGVLTAGAGEQAAATPTNAVLAFTAGANGARIVSAIATNDETATAHMVGLYRYDGTNSWFLWAVNVPLSSGYASGIANVDLLASPIVGLPMDASDKPILALGPNEKLYVGVFVVMGTGKNLSITVIGENF